MHGLIIYITSFSLPSLCKIVKHFRKNIMTLISELNIMVLLAHMFHIIYRVAQKAANFKSAVKGCAKEPSDDAEINACSRQLLTLDRLAAVTATIINLRKAFKTQYVRINAIYKSKLPLFFVILGFL